MPGSENSDHEWVRQQAGFTAAVDLAIEAQRVLVEQAAAVSIELGLAVTVLGAWGPHGVLCLFGCCYRGAGGIVVVPDILAAELEANGGVVGTDGLLSRCDGRSVLLFAGGPVGGVTR